MNLPILMYHVIQPEPMPGSNLAVPISRFQGQVAYLRKSGYQSIALADLIDRLRCGKPLPRRPVVFTFDDALDSVMENAFPILHGAGFTATVFVVSQAVGRHNHWDDGKNLPRRACLDAGQIRRLRAEGWEIGSHGATHASLQNLPPDPMRVETLGSKHELENILGAPVNVFCYPYGAWDATAEAAVREAGYAAACSVSPGTPSVTADWYALRRVWVKPGDSLWAFRRKISGWYLAYRAWRKR
jgi:peptidoglycan/xylan/chitin deacetylase (PgdA/CDA1 family)